MRAACEDGLSPWAPCVALDALPGFPWRRARCADYGGIPYVETSLAPVPRDLEHQGQARPPGRSCERSPTNAKTGKPSVGWKTQHWIERLTVLGLVARRPKQRETGSWGRGSSCEATGGPPAGSMDLQAGGGRAGAWCRGMSDLAQPPRAWFCYQIKVSYRLTSVRRSRKLQKSCEASERIHGLVGAR
jgi:hypothetical protein